MAFKIFSTDAMGVSNMSYCKKAKTDISLRILQHGQGLLIHLYKSQVDQDI